MCHLRVWGIMDAQCHLRVKSQKTKVESQKMKVESQKTKVKSQKVKDEL